MEIKTLCPECHTLQPGERWTKVDRSFESIRCSKCGVEYGRVISPGYTGQWHNLGESAEHGLKISRRAHEDKGA
jgi:hypothetical protein